MTMFLKSDLFRKFAGGFVAGIAIMVATQPGWLSGVASVIHAA